MSCYNIQAVVGFNSIDGVGDVVVKRIFESVDCECYDDDCEHSLAYFNKKAELDRKKKEILKDMAMSNQIAKVPVVMSSALSGGFAPKNRFAAKIARVNKLNVPTQNSKRLAAHADYQHWVADCLDEMQFWGGTREDELPVGSFTFSYNTPVDIFIKGSLLADFSYSYAPVLVDVTIMGALPSIYTYSYTENPICVTVKGNPINHIFILPEKCVVSSKPDFSSVLLQANIGEVRPGVKSCKFEEVTTNYLQKRFFVFKKKTFYRFTNRRRCFRFRRKKKPTKCFDKNESCYRCGSCTTYKYGTGSVCTKFKSECPNDEKLSPLAKFTCGAVRVKFRL